MNIPRFARLATAVAAVGALGLSIVGCTTQEQSSGPVTVTWWAWNPDETTAQTYIDAFEAEYPDITIDYRFIQYSDYANTVQLGLQSGSGPAAATRATRVHIQPDARTLRYQLGPPSHMWLGKPEHPDSQPTVYARGGPRLNTP